MPDSGGANQAVVVIQEWWGLVPHITSVADRFAAAGFVALVPDLYRGVPATEPDHAGRLSWDWPWTRPPGTSPEPPTTWPSGRR